jgi:hypothetical protein
MADRVEAALSAEEWAVHRAQMEADDFGYNAIPYWAGLRGAPAAIAIANDVLDDSDDRKLTDRHVAMLRDAARVAELEGLEHRDLLVLADVLESYLPPEEDDDDVIPLYPSEFPGLPPELQRKLDESL